jgi:hypothetical protein
MKSFIKSTPIAILIILIINGCNPYSVPLKGKYIESPIEFTSTVKTDSIWLNITKIFSQNGLAVKKIDTVNGLILSKDTRFIHVYSFEDKDGNLEVPQAWVVLKKNLCQGKAMDPKEIRGEWRIQINQTDSGVTKIKIDPIVDCTYFPNMFASMNTSGLSTGKLEKLIDSALLNSSTVSKH